MFRNTSKKRASGNAQGARRSQIKQQDLNGSAAPAFGLTKESQYTAKHVNPRSVLKINTCTSKWFINRSTSMAVSAHRTGAHTELLFRFESKQHAAVIRKLAGCRPTKPQILALTISKIIESRRACIKSSYFTQECKQTFSEAQATL
jgi:hypothetical protein